MALLLDFLGGMGAGVGVGVVGAVIKGLNELQKYSFPVVFQYSKTATQRVDCSVMDQKTVFHSDTGQCSHTLMGAF